MATTVFLSDLDLSGSQLLNAVAQNLATAPTPTKGRLFYNTTTDKFGCGNGSSFDYIGGLAITNMDDVPDSSTRLAFLVAERTKLNGIATNATANAADATLLARGNHTGTQSADTILDGTTNHVFTVADDTKLTGVATGATVNASDAVLLARGNHTGTQVAATINDFATAADLRVVAGITGKADIASPTFTGTVGGITKTMVGLANVDNTTDAAKPVSSAAQTALNLKANLASPAFTGTPTGLTKAHVGLANVDNTTDAAKPISTAQATGIAGAKDRSLHTGTQTAATISDFSAAADARIQLIVAAAPAALDTLNELAAALGDDPNFAATLTTRLNAVDAAIALRALDSGVCHKFNTTMGTGAATTIVVTHNLNTLYVTTSICRVSDNAFVMCDVVATTVNSITLSFTVAPALNALRLSVQG
jgi:hypothetical protein